MDYIHIDMCMGNVLASCSEAWKKKDWEIEDREFWARGIWLNIWK